jgi:hypothetical protein
MGFVPLISVFGAVQRFLRDGAHDEPVNHRGLLRGGRSAQP